MTSEIEKLADMMYVKEKEAIIKETTEEKKLDFFLDLLFKVPKTFREKLSINDDDFQSTDGPEHFDCRAYYFYGLCEELIKTGVAALHWRELIEGPELTKPTTMEDRIITRVVLDRIADEQNLWKRKLMEHLINTICLSENNKQPYYRGFLAAEALDKYLSKENDLKEFFSCNNKNIHKLILHYAEIIETIQKSEGITQLPFLRQKITTKKKLPKAGMVFKSIRKRFKQAILLASSEEKVALGSSYGLSISLVSQSMHATVLSKSKAWKPQATKGGINEVWLIAINLILRAYNLCGIAPEGRIKQIQSIFLKSSNAPSLIRETVEKKLKPGDIILAYDNLAEVLSMLTSEYGYTSFKIRYLGKPPIPEIVEDEFPALVLRLIIAKKNIKDYLKKGLLRIPDGKAAWKDIKNLSNEKFHNAIRKIFLDLDRRGLLKQIFRQQKKTP